MPKHVSCHEHIGKSDNDGKHHKLRYWFNRDLFMPSAIHSWQRWSQMAKLIHVQTLGLMSLGYLKPITTRFVIDGHLNLGSEDPTL